MGTMAQSSQDDNSARKTPKMVVKRPCLAFTFAMVHTTQKKSQPGASSVCILDFIQPSFLPVSLSFIGALALRAITAAFANISDFDFRSCVSHLLLSTFSLLMSSPAFCSSPRALSNATEATLVSSALRREKIDSI